MVQTMDPLTQALTLLRCYSNEELTALTSFRIDKFRVPALDIGKIIKIKVKHDGGGKSPSWYLNKVNKIH